MDEKTRRIVRGEGDWLDRARDPRHGSAGMWGFIAAAVLTVGGVAIALAAWFGG